MSTISEITERLYRYRRIDAVAADEFEQIIKAVVRDRNERIAKLEAALREARNKFKEIRVESMWAKDVTAEQGIAAIDAVLGDK